MQAGQLRNWITVSAPLSAQDTYGQPVQGSGPASPVLSTWASIAAVTGRDVYAQGAGFTQQITHKLRIRWTATPIAAGMTVTFGTRFFLIQVVSDPDEMRREQDLLVLEQTK